VYETLDEVTLKDGRGAKVGVVTAPDRDWSGILEHFLAHQGPLWSWQHRTLLRTETAISVYYYVLHVSGRPVSVMMTAESKGVGIRGHVWTPPAQRRLGASSRLMRSQMAHFRARGGRFLGAHTDYNSAAYHLYRRHGFEETESFGGHMAFYGGSPADFRADYFAPAETTIEPLGWSSWATAPVLFMSDCGGQVKCAALRLVGQLSSEEPLLNALRTQNESSETPRVRVLRNSRTGAVVGVAAWSLHPGFGDACLVDFYCHPDFWDRAQDLFDALELPPSRRWLCFGDASQVEKARVLSGRGFRQVAVWRDFPIDLCRHPFERLPRNPRRGRLAKAAWTVGHWIDRPISGSWRFFTRTAGLPARIPTRWPRFPWTHRLFTTLVLYERKESASAAQDPKAARPDR